MLVDCDTSNIAEDALFKVEDYGILFARWRVGRLSPGSSTTTKEVLGRHDWTDGPYMFSPQVCRSRSITTSRSL